MSEKNNGGFTVIEMLIVIVTLLAVLAIVGKGFTRMYRWYQKSETQRNLALIAEGLSQYYKTKAWDIDGITDAKLIVQNINNSVLLSDNTKMDSVTGKNAAQMLANSFVSLSQGNIEYDAFGTPYIIRVSQRIGSGDIRYRNIIVISAGPNKKIDSTFDPTTGQFKLAGDDMAAVVSGQEIESAKYYDTLKKMNKYVQFLEQSFALAFASDPTRDVSVDHFLNSTKDGSVNQYVDPTNGLANTCNLNTDMSIKYCFGRPDQLGVKLSTDSSVESESSAWFYPGMTNQNTYIYIDNDSPNVRSPDNGSTPPYTARVVTYTPWGTEISLVAIGSTG